MYCMIINEFQRRINIRNKLLTYTELYIFTLFKYYINKKQSYIFC